MRSQKSFTLIITMKKNMQSIFSGGKSAMPIGRQTSSFTLIELLIVIGILAILVAAVVVVLNPAQLLAQARDSKRQQDLSALNQALNTVYALDQTISFGTSSTVYTSLPDSSSTCGSWGLPSLPTGWTYNCVPTSTLQQTNGTGWIPVNFQSNGVVNLSSLPLDPVNASSSNLYYTYITGGSFKLSATMESQKYASLASSDGGTISGAFELGSNLALGQGVFPSGWIRVPGNATFGTSDFWVMKYAATCSDATGAVVNAPTDGNGYNNGATPCTPANNRQISSLPGGIQIVDISHTTAASYCTSIGAHLITNDEYMTIATNAANQSSNWTGGSVGSGGMYLGNANNASEYPADANDANGYAGETNKTVTNPNDERRTLVLSNGQVIWDLSGNVWEHVARSINNVGDLTTAMALPSCSNASANWEWCQYGNTNAPYISAYSSDVTQLMVAPPNSSWNTSQGMGQVYTYGTGANQNTTVFLRGDDWYGGSYDGPFALYLTWNTGVTAGAVGFRCAR